MFKSTEEKREDLSQHEKTDKDKRNLTNSDTNRSRSTKHEWTEDHRIQWVQKKEMGSK